MDKTVMYANTPDGFKHWLHVIFALLISANTLHMLTLSFRDIPNETAWQLISGIGFIFVCFHFWLSWSLLKAVSKANSVAAEILYDAKACQTALKMKRWKPALVFSNSFLVMYLPVMPYAVFVLFRHRKCLTTALDPRVLVQDPEPHHSLAFLMHRLLVKNHQLSIIPAEVVNEHFVQLGDTYFIKDKRSASFLRLSYSEHDLLNAFGINNEEIFSTMVELSKPGYGMDDLMTDAAIKAAFRMC